MEKTFDVIIVGGGPGGYVAAIRAAQLGLSVAVIEKERLGGVCLNWGCIPTKALLHCADVMHSIRHAQDYGIAVEHAKPNLSAMISRSRDISNRLADGVSTLMRKNGVRVFYGTATLLGECNVQITASDFHADVEKQVISGHHIIIATGSIVRELPNVPLNHTTVLNYRDALTLRELPDKLLIVGGGVTSAEFATFYNALGTNVTIAEVSHRILASEDTEIVDIAAKCFTERGITILTNTSVTRLELSDSGVDVELTDGDGNAKTSSYDKVLSVVGLMPNTGCIGLQNTNVALDDHGFIIVDDLYRTNDANICAIGDVIGHPMLAHKASHDGIICVEALAGEQHIHKMKRNNIPACIYSSPQIASVGLTEKAALDMGMHIKVGRFPGIANGKAIAIGEEKCAMVKVIFDSDSGELLGIHMIGPNVSEMVQGMAILKEMEGTEEYLMHTIFPHPTLSEMIQEASLAAYGRALHI